jgi:hypothetical protein
VLLSIRERDYDLHGPRRLRPVRRQRPAAGSAHPPQARARRSAGSSRARDRRVHRIHERANVSR